jgi:hypothetical protein
MTQPTRGIDLSPSQRSAFWQAVEDCLVEFHAKKRPNALQKTAELRREFEAPPPGIDGDLIYHSEPFYVACEIAGMLDPRKQEKLLESNQIKYDSLLKSDGW